MRLSRGVAVWLALACFSAHAAPAAPTLQSEADTEVPSRSVNVRVNPLGLLIGAISADVDIKAGQKLTIGPTLSYMSASFLTTKLSGFGVGVRANYYLSGDAMSDSWIIGPSAGLAIFSVNAGGESASSTGIYVGAIVGRQWVFSNGLNINVGLGMNWYSQGASVKTAGGFEMEVPFFHGIAPAGEITLGYAF